MSSDSALFLYCLFQEPQWWQWQHSMQMTLPRITLCCATTSSDSHQTSLPQTCSTSMQKKATLSLSSHPRYLTERWVNVACVHSCVCIILHWVIVLHQKDFAAQVLVTSFTLVTGNSQIRLVRLLFLHRGCHQLSKVESRKCLCTVWVSVGAECLL